VSVRDTLKTEVFLEAKNRRQGIGGWLAFLVFYLLFLLPIGATLLIIRTLKFPSAAAQLMKIGLASNLVYRIAVLAITALGIYAGVALVGRFPGAVAATKRFLIIYMIAGIAVAILADQGWQMLLADAVSAVIFPAIWYAYLNRSRRIASTYLGHPPSSTVPT
jgi:hypothetical protein